MPKGKEYLSAACCDALCGVYRNINLLHSYYHEIACIIAERGKESRTQRSNIISYHFLIVYCEYGSEWIVFSTGLFLSLKKLIRCCCCWWCDLHIHDFSRIIHLDRWMTCLVCDDMTAMFLSLGLFSCNLFLQARNEEVASIPGCHASAFKNFYCKLWR